MLIVSESFSEELAQITEEKKNSKRRGQSILTALKLYNKNDIYYYYSNIKEKLNLKINYPVMYKMYNNNVKIYTKSILYNMSRK